MQLPTLYSRRGDGRIQFWSIEVDGPKYRMISGIHEMPGVVYSEWTVAKGKNIGRSNETTPEQQALAEAQSKWTHKKERKYAESVEAVDSIEMIQPMLAKKYEDRKDKIVFPVYAQPKLDGMRCVHPNQGPFSRQGKPIITVPHITEALQPILKAMPGIIPDGELYCDKYANDFDSLISHAKKQKPTAEDLEAARALEYWIYDLVDLETDFAGRANMISELLAEHPSKFLKVVPTVLVNNAEELDKLYEEWVEAGYEGQMIRINAEYETKRSANLLKRKEFQDDEFLITEVLEGVGNRSGMAGMIGLVNATGQSFKAGIKGGEKVYRRMWDNRDLLVGKYATIKYFHLTPGGIPRFPVCISIRDYE